MSDANKDGALARNILLVLFSMALVVSVLVTVLHGKRIKEQQAKELARMKQLGLECKKYAVDHGGKYPPTLEALYPQYVSDRAQFVSPYAPSLPDGYDYTVGLTDKSDGSAVLIKEHRVPAGKQQIVLYADGTAKVQ